MHYNTLLFTLGRELYTFLNVYLQWPQTEIICFTLFVVIAVLQFSHICRDSTRVTWPLQWPQTEIIFFTAELYTIKINNICWKINIRRITTVFTGFKTKPQIYTLAITINDQNTTVGITFYNKNLSHTMCRICHELLSKHIKHALKKIQPEKVKCCPHKPLQD